MNPLYRRQFLLSVIFLQVISALLSSPIIVFKKKIE